MHVSLYGESAPAERGLRLSDSLAVGIHSRISHEPLALELTADFLPEDDASRYAYDFSLIAAMLEGRLGCGFRGSIFDSDGLFMPDDINEIYLSLGSNSERVTMMRWDCSIAFSLDSDHGIYADSRIASTLALGERADADCEIYFGWGNSGVTEKLLQGSRGGFDGSREWSHVGGKLSLPVMLGPVDLIPACSYTSIVGGAARRVLRDEGVETQFWGVRITAVMYFQ